MSFKDFILTESPYFVGEMACPFKDEPHVIDSSLDLKKDKIDFKYDTVAELLVTNYKDYAMIFLNAYGVLADGVAPALCRTHNIIFMRKADHKEEPDFCYAPKTKEELLICRVWLATLRSDYSAKDRNKHFDVKKLYIYGFKNYQPKPGEEIDLSTIVVPEKKDKKAIEVAKARKELK